jgi:hypothetical protein
MRWCDLLLLLLLNIVLTVWSAVIIKDSTTERRTAKSIWSFLLDGCKTWYLSMTGEYKLQTCDRRDFWENFWISEDWGQKAPQNSLLCTSYFLVMAIKFTEPSGETQPSDRNMTSVLFCRYQKNTGITYTNRTRMFSFPSPPMSFITIPVWPTSFDSTKIQQLVQRIACHINPKRTLLSIVYILFRNREVTGSNLNPAFNCDWCSLHHSHQGLLPHPYSSVILSQPTVHPYDNPPINLKKKKVVKNVK